VVSTGIANPWKEDTEDIVPQIRKIIHAASRILSVKIINLQDYLADYPCSYIPELIRRKF
jgi:hypothetical protein